MNPFVLAALIVGVVFALPKSCQEVRSAGETRLDIDGEGRLPPVKVFCDENGESWITLPQQGPTWNYGLNAGMDPHGVPCITTYQRILLDADGLAANTYRVLIGTQNYIFGSLMDPTLWSNGKYSTSTGSVTWRTNASTTFVPYGAGFGCVPPFQGSANINLLGTDFAIDITKSQISFAGPASSGLVTYSWDSKVCNITNAGGKCGGTGAPQYLYLTGPPVPQSPPPPVVPPPLPPISTTPYIRVGNVIPTSDSLTISITQGAVTRSWDNLLFSNFTTWMTIFQPGPCQITVRSPLSDAINLNVTRDLTPGPLLIVVRGVAPYSDSTVYTIASSYNPVPVTDTAVRLVNLIYNCERLTLSSRGNPIISNVHYPNASPHQLIPYIENQMFLVQNSNGDQPLLYVSGKYQGQAWTILALGDVVAPGFSPQLLVLKDAPE